VCVRATAVAFGIPYDEAYAIMETGAASPEGDPGRGLPQRVA